MTKDTKELREVISKLLPGLKLNQLPAHQAKELPPALEERIKWKQIVVKVLEQLSPVNIK